LNLLFLRVFATNEAEHAHKHDSLTFPIGSGFQCVARAKHPVPA
jgi:hypothetical protein